MEINLVLGFAFMQSNNARNFSTQGGAILNLIRTVGEEKVADLNGVLVLYQ